MTLLRARTTFIAGVNGRKVVVNEGAIHDSADPVVSGREHLFETIAAEPVEQATAAPGEKRAVRRKKK